MTDPLIPATVGEVIEKVGLTIAAIVGLLYVLRWLSYLHLTALNARISTLENELVKKDAVIAIRDQRIEKLQGDILDRTEVHAHDMKAVAMQMLANDKANRDFLRDHQMVVREMLAREAERMRLAPDYQPHPTPPPAYQSGATLPSVPETDRTTGRA